MAQKIGDLAVKTGTKNDGKGRYQNCGALMQVNNGQFLMMDRTFNPAGVPNPDGRDSVLVSVFEPRQQGGGQQAPQQAAPNSGPSNPGDSLDDDTPF